jgi:hypothetical protein
MRKVKKVKKRGAGGEHEGQRREDGEDDEFEWRHINLGAKNTASMQPGERIIVVSVSPDQSL